MDSSLIVALINGGGFAGIVVVLMVMGWLVPKWVYKKLEKENKHLREALEYERRARVEASSQGVITTNQLLGALVNMAEKNRPAELSGKDP